MRLRLAPDPVSNQPRARSSERQRIRGLNRDGWRPVAWCLAAYAALAILVFFPVGPLDSRQLPLPAAGNPAGNDPFQMTWFLSYVPYALTHGLSIFHTNYIDYPSGVNLADNTSVPLLGILGWPITATLGPIADLQLLDQALVRPVGREHVPRPSQVVQFVAGTILWRPAVRVRALHGQSGAAPRPDIRADPSASRLVRRRAGPQATNAGCGARPAHRRCFGGAIPHLAGHPERLSAMALLVGVGLAIRFRQVVRSRLAYIIKAGILAAGSFAALAAYPVYEMLLGPGRISGPVVPVAFCSPRVQTCSVRSSRHRINSSSRASCHSSATTSSVATSPRTARTSGSRF